MTAKGLIGVWNDEMQCNVVSLVYDFVNRRGQLNMEDAAVTDMSGCIRFFERIDAGVSQIETYSGDEADTVYQRKDGKWISGMRA